MRCVNCPFGCGLTVGFLYCLQAFSPMDRGKLTRTIKHGKENNNGLTGLRSVIEQNTYFREI